MCIHVSIECGTVDTDLGYSEATLLTLTVPSGRAIAVNAESVLNDLIVLGKNESAGAYPRCVVFVNCVILSRC